MLTSCLNSRHAGLPPTLPAERRTVLPSFCRPMPNSPSVPLPTSHCRMPPSVPLHVRVCRTRALLQHAFLPDPRPAWRAPTYLPNVASSAMLVQPPCRIRLRYRFQLTHAECRPRPTCSDLLCRIRGRPYPLILPDQRLPGQLLPTCRVRLRPSSLYLCLSNPRSTVPPSSCLTSRRPRSASFPPDDAAPSPASPYLCRIGGRKRGPQRRRRRRTRGANEDLPRIRAEPSDARLLLLLLLGALNTDSYLIVENLAVPSHLLLASVPTSRQTPAAEPLRGG